MELTDAERCILLNQFEILKKLKPSSEDKKSYERIQEILQRGYEFLYHEACAAGELFTTVPASDSDEVYKIFDMFRVLQDSYQGLTTEDKKALRESDLQFSGFDGNHEGNHFGFARFLVEKMDLYAEQKGARFNSHCGMLSAYRRMLQAYNEGLAGVGLGDVLDLEALQKVAAARTIR